MSEWHESCGGGEEEVSGDCAGGGASILVALQGFASHDRGA